jgi:hypothetical protein
VDEEKKKLIQQSFGFLNKIYDQQKELIMKKKIPELKKKVQLNKLKKELKENLVKVGLNLDDMDISDEEEMDETQLQGTDPSVLPHHSSIMSAVYYRQNFKTGYCPYSKTNRNTRQVWAMHQVNPYDYDRMFNRDLTLDGSNVYLQDPYNSPLIQRNLRTDITKFKRDRKHKRDIRNWEKFLNGERAIYEEPQQVNKNDSKVQIP